METEFLLRCSQRDVPVTKKHSCSVEYTRADGVAARYIPDFITIDGSKVMHEVKGLVDEETILKIRAAEEWCVANGWTYELHLADEFEGVR